MSLRIAVVLAALLVCANAQFLNFGTYAEDFEPAAGFVLTTIDDNANTLRGGRAGLLQSSTVLVVKVGSGVNNLAIGQTVYPALQRAIGATGSILSLSDSTAGLGVDTRAYCPQPLDINPTFVVSGSMSSAANPMGYNDPTRQVINPTQSTANTTPYGMATLPGRYCIYHETQIAAVVNNQATRGSPGSSQIFNSYGFVSNVAGTTRPTL